MGATLMSGLPPLPPGYAFDEQPNLPPLPPGYSMAPAESQPPTLSPTRPVSPDPSATGEALQAGWNMLKGPVLTSAVRGLGGVANAAWDPYGTIMAPWRKFISPEEEARYQKAEPPGPGTKLGDAFFRTTGIPEYQPTTAPGRMMMGTLEGAAAGAPFGIGGMLLGATSGGAGQSVREAGGGERLATAAELVPGLLMSGREARRQGPAVPTAPELKAAGQAQLRAFGNSPVELSPAPVAGMSATAEAALQRGGFRPRNAPGTFDLLGDLRQQPDTGGWATGANPASNASLSATNVQPRTSGRSLTMHDLQAIREDLAGTINDNRSPLAAHPRDFAAATATLRRLDDIILNMHNNPADLTAGTMADALAAVNNFTTGRANYLAGQNLNRMTGDLDRAHTGVVEKATNRARAANSGANLDNTLRQRVESFLENRNNVAGLSDDSLAALDRVVAGGAISNRIRDAANFLGGGKGLGALVTGGMGAASAGFAGRPGLAGALAIGAPATGILLKGLENRLARGRLDTALDTIARDSPLYRERAANFQPDYWAIARPSIPGLLADQPDRRWGF